MNFGMTGKLRCQHSASAQFIKHDAAYFDLHDDTTLVFNDVRRFGYILLNPPATDNLIEPLSDAFNKSYVEKYQQLSRTIKSLLMDNSFVVGVGNIYANEILFKAKVLPWKQVNQVNLHKILVPTKKILRQAIRSGGTTFRDFSALGNAGGFQSHLQVYGRSFCSICNSKILKTKISGRATYFCQHCQN